MLDEETPALPSSNRNLTPKKLNSSSENDLIPNRKMARQLQTPRGESTSIRERLKLDDL